MNTFLILATIALCLTPGAYLAAEAKNIVLTAEQNATLTALINQLLTGYASHLNATNGTNLTGAVIPTNTTVNVPANTTQPANPTNNPAPADPVTPVTPADPVTPVTPVTPTDVDNTLTPTNPTNNTTPVDSTNTTSDPTPVSSTNTTSDPIPVTPAPYIKRAKNDVNMATFAQDTLNAHNYERNQLNLTFFTWSDSLATTAQAWADNMAMSSFRHSGGPYGENIASTTYSTKTLRRLLGLWTGERAHFIVGCKYPSCSTNSEEVGHYTQMVWAKTTQVGCGFAAGHAHLSNYLVCQYLRAGNVIGQYVY